MTSAPTPTSSPRSGRSSPPPRAADWPQEQSSAVATAERGEDHEAPTAYSEEAAGEEETKKISWPPSAAKTEVLPAHEPATEHIEQAEGRRLAVQAGQIAQGEQVSLHAASHDHAGRDRAQIRMVPELFAGKDIGDVHLDQRRAQLGAGVA